MTLFGYSFIKTKDLTRSEQERKALQDNLLYCTNNKSVEYKVNSFTPCVPSQVFTIPAITQIMGKKITWYLDTTHKSIEKEDVLKLLALRHDIADGNYILNQHDCNAFAAQLWGWFNQESLSDYAFGFATSHDHAFNFFIDGSKQVWIVEPQDRPTEGSVFKLGALHPNGLDYNITRYLI
jgi:hypothetical protein